MLSKSSKTWKKLAKSYKQKKISSLIKNEAQKGKKNL